MKTKKPLGIILGITDNWAFAAGTVLIGMKKHVKKTPYDTIIYHNGLSHEHQATLNRIYPCDFREYEAKVPDVDKFRRVSLMTFSRYECFELLSYYRNVLWIDADVLVMRDLSTMLEQNTSGIAMYKHSGIPMSVSFSDSVPNYDMNRECFNAGILLLNDNLKERTLLKKWCYEQTAECVNAVNSDQAVINLMLQAFDLTVSELDIRYNCPSNQETRETVILHPWGEQKFWNGIVHPLWDSYYKQWRNLGGDGPQLERPSRWRFLNPAHVSKALWIRARKITTKMVFKD